MFSRSEARRNVLDKSVLIGYTDLSRPKVKTWCKCAVCGKPEAKSYMEVDHIDPIIPVDSALEDMSWDQVIDRIWCEPENLQVVCESCHKEKTKAERKQRTLNRKGKKKP